MVNTMTYEQLSLFTDEELGLPTSHPGYEVIGLTGYAQSGKDTVASILVEKYGYRRIAFADKIRDFLFWSIKVLTNKYGIYTRIID